MRHFWPLFRRWHAPSTFALPCALVVAMSCASTDKSSKVPVGATIPKTQHLDFHKPNEIESGKNQRRPSAEAYNAFLHAELDVHEGRTQQAITSIENALLYDADSAHLWVRLAELKNNVGDRGGAEDALLQALKRDPKHKRALFLNAWFLASGGATQKAIDTLENALELYPSDAELTPLLARLYVQNDRISDAERIFLLMMDNAPDRIDGYLILANVFVQQGDLARCEEAIDKALARDERSASALLAKMNVQLSRGNFEGAKSSLLALANERGDAAWLRQLLLTTTLLNDPKDPEAQELVSAWLDEDRSEENVSLIVGAYENAGLRRHAQTLLLNESASAQKTNPRFAIERGRLFIEDRSFERASAALCPLEESVGPRGLFLYARSLCVRALSHQQRYEDALRSAREGLKVDPRSIGILSNLLNISRNSEALRPAIHALVLEQDVREGDTMAELHARVFLQEGDERKALALLNQRAQARPSDADRAMGLARFLDRIGRKGDAARVAMGLMEQESPDLDVLNFTAFTLAEAKRETQKATAFATRALYEGPLNGYVLDTLGWALFQNQEFERALEVLERANRLSPNEPEILFHLAHALKKSGDKERAKLLFSEAKKLCSDVEEVCQRIRKSRL